VVIDSYDVAIMQRCEQTSAKHREASEILNKNNPNYPENMNAPEGLEGVQRRFVGFNGAVGRLQLSWLRQTLQEARTANEKVVVVSHQPIMPDSSNEVCLIWNYEDVLEILRDHADVVVASFSGHAHKGGYVRDPQSGIHFRVFEAALENRPERTYAMVDVHEDRLTVRGFGNCRSAVYDFEHTCELSHADV
jgi:manganese-dependent ADP-ribose/CDP-alcohol diphosphatase